MKFGKIYELKYKIGIKNKTDKKPRIILIQETEQRIIGINLNYYAPIIQEIIIELFNQEIFKRFSFDNELLMEALNRQKEIDNNKLARLYISHNAENTKIMMKAAKNLKIKSATRLYKLLEHGCRIYKKEEIDE